VSGLPKSAGRFSFSPDVTLRFPFPALVDMTDRQFLIPYFLCPALRSPFHFHGSDWFCWGRLRFLDHLRVGRISPDSFSFILWSFVSFYRRALEMSLFSEDLCPLTGGAQLLSHYHSFTPSSFTGGAGWWWRTCARRTVNEDPALSYSTPIQRDQPFFGTLRFSPVPSLFERFIGAQPAGITLETTRDGEDRKEILISPSSCTSTPVDL